jgi:AcrR family transcriptional regulator
LLAWTPHGDTQPGCVPHCSMMRPPPRRPQRTRRRRRRAKHQPISRSPPRSGDGRAELQAAADRLFAERGFAHTTVQDIADAAGVTARTFFRYFASKEDLILDETLSWLQKLTDTIRVRPPTEPPSVATERLLAQLATLVNADSRLTTHEFTGATKVGT